jgi:hypothetical protein
MLLKRLIFSYVIGLTLVQICSEDYGIPSANFYRG